AACFVHAVETLEDTGLILFRDAEAVVANADERLSFALLGSEGYSASGRVRVLEGVIEKDVDDAAQCLGIAKNPEFGAENSLAEIQTTNAGDGTPAGGNLLQGSEQIHGLDVELLATRVGSGQGEEFFDQRGSAFGLQKDVAEGLTIFAVIARPAEG